MSFAVLFWFALSQVEGRFNYCQLLMNELDYPAVSDSSDRFISALCRFGPLFTKSSFTVASVKEINIILGKKKTFLFTSTDMENFSVQ